MEPVATMLQSLMGETHANDFSRPDRMEIITVFHVYHLPWKPVIWTDGFHCFHQVEKSVYRVIL